MTTSVIFDQPGNGGQRYFPPPAAGKPSHGGPAGSIHSSRGWMTCVTSALVRGVLLVDPDVLELVDVGCRVVLLEYRLADGLTLRCGLGALGLLGGLDRLGGLFAFAVLACLPAGRLCILLRRHGIPSPCESGSRWVAWPCYAVPDQGSVTTLIG